jgi:hypothetical protein
MCSSCRINSYNAGNRTRQQLPNPSVISGMFPTHCKAQGRHSHEHKHMRHIRCPPNTLGESLSVLSIIVTHHLDNLISLSLVPSLITPGLFLGQKCMNPTMTRHLWKDIFRVSMSLNPENISTEIHGQFQFGQKPTETEYIKFFDTHTPNKIPHLTR